MNFLHTILGGRFYPIMSLFPSFLHYPIIPFSYPPLSYRPSYPYPLFHLLSWQGWESSWTSYIPFTTFSLSQLFVFIHRLLTTFHPYSLAYCNLLSLSFIPSQPSTHIPYPFFLYCLSYPYLITVHALFFVPWSWSDIRT